MNSGQPVPNGYHSVTPYLAIDGAADAIAFYKKAFGATEVMRMAAPRGKVGHAEIEIGGSRIMISGTGPRPATPAFLYVYVSDADAVYRRAIAAFFA